MNQEYLKKLLKYDPETGIFTWIIDRYRKKIGSTAGCIRIWKSNKRIGIRIDGKEYKAHRLAFLYMTGSIPNYVDHIDGNGLNNSWNNLRMATMQENSFNSKKRCNNKTNYKGVTFKPNNKKNPYKSSITYNGKQKHLGYFLTQEEAAKAYNAAAIEYFGKFAKLNII